MVPEAKPDSPYFYYVKKPAGGEKAKVKLSQKNIIQIQENTKCLWRKSFHHTVNKLFFKISSFVIDIRPNHIFQIRLVIFGSMPCFKDFALIFLK